MSLSPTLNRLLGGETLAREEATAAFDAILRDQTPEGRADNRAMAGLMLMRERDLDVVTRISEAAASRGWTELTPHLVRSLARPIEDLTLDERPERDALLAIHPERSLAEIAFDVFLNPGVDPGPYDVRYDLRARADAWELIARVDPDRSMRQSLLLSAEADRVASDVEILRKLRRGFLDLGATPSAAEEMRWMLRLRDQADGMNTEWWTRAASANDRLRDDQRDRLELRHAEPIRWVAANRSSQLDTSRQDLIRELGDRLAARRVIERGVNDFGAGRQPDEDFESNIPRLSWADLVAILVVDDAIQTPRVVREIFDAVELDRWLGRAWELGPARKFVARDLGMASEIAGDFAAAKGERRGANACYRLAAAHFAPLDPRDTARLAGKLEATC